MTVKEKEIDQDPTESEVAQKLTSYMTPQLKITDRKDDYRKRRLTKYCASEKQC
jgi:hypothetical protein